MQKRTIIIGIAAVLLVVVGVVIGVSLGGSSTPTAVQTPSSNQPGTGTSSTGTSGLTAMQLLQKLVPTTIRGMRCTYVENEASAISTAIPYVVSQAGLLTVANENNGCFTADTWTSASKLRLFIQNEPEYVVLGYVGGPWPTTFAGPDWVILSNTSQPLSKALIARVERATGGTLLHFYQTCTGHGLARACYQHGAPG